MCDSGGVGIGIRRVLIEGAFGSCEFLFRKTPASP